MTSKIDQWRLFLDPWFSDVFGPWWFYWFVVVSVVTMIGYIVGFVREQQHYFSLWRRERKLTNILISNSKSTPPGSRDGALVATNIALATDSFRVFSILFRRLFGGRVRRYERIKDRARREAIIRLKQAALAKGQNAVYNVRIQSSQITASGRGGAASVEVLAYGTAVVVKAGTA